MRIFLLILLFNQAIFSCESENIGSVITIIATIKNIPSKKVYLAEAHEWYKFLDSSDYMNNTFLFHITPENGFAPFMISISYIDSNTKKIKTLEFENNVLSVGSPKYFYNAFMIEKGETILRGNLEDKKNGIWIKSGIQTEALYTVQMMNFGYVDGDRKDGREIAIKNYKKLIVQYPSSYYFLGEILNNKELYSSNELRDYLNLFTTELQKSRLADVLNNYLQNRTDSKKRLMRFTLETSNGIQKTVIDTSTKLNMLVFWASWCAPCRREIPELKLIYRELKDKGLNVVSISIDNDKEKWKNALVQENMPWEQMIIESVAIERIQHEYDFYSIPFMVITDKTGKPLSRSIGFDPQKTFEERSHFLKSLLIQQK